MSLRTKIEQYARITQNVVIILGVFGGIISLIAVQFDKRVTRTLELYKDYASALRKDTVELDLRWAKFSAVDTSLLTKKIEDQRKLVSEFFQDTENQRSLIALLSFYDILFVCVRSRACDRNSAIDLFGTTAKSIFEIAAHHILERRRMQRDPMLGYGLEQLYRLKRDQWFERYLYF